MTNDGITLRPQYTRGWWPGFINLLGKGLRDWWATSRWLIQALLWLVILNGGAALFMVVVPRMTGPDGQPLLPGDPLANGLAYFFSIGSLAQGIAVVALAQNAVLDERRSGTAAWVLSKPVTREAFVLAKLLAHAASVLALMVLLPGAVLYAETLLLSGDPGITLLGFLAALGSLALYLLFTLTLTLMLSVLARSSGLVLGVSLGVLLGGMLLVQLIPALGHVGPWLLPDLATALATATPTATPGWGPWALTATAAWVTGFVITALAAFRWGGL